jgi:hypothetical protein
MSIGWRDLFVINMFTEMPEPAFRVALAMSIVISKGCFRAFADGGI